MAALKARARQSSSSDDNFAPILHTMDIETLDNTAWDVVIVGTGLQQSLLAL